MARTPRLVSTLTARVRRNLFWPAIGGPFTDEEIAECGNELIEDDLYPKVVEADGHHLTAVHDAFLITGSDYDEPEGYQVPIESQAQIEHVAYMDAQGRPSPLELYEEREWDEFIRLQHTSDSGRPIGYAFRGGRLRLLPHPTSVDTGERVRVWYEARLLPMSTDADAIYRTLTTTPTSDGSVVTYTCDSAVASSAWDSNNSDLVVLSPAPPYVPVEYLDNGDNAGYSGSAFDITISTAWPGAQNNPTRARGGDLLIGGYLNPLVPVPSEAYGLLIDGICARLARPRADRTLKDDYSRKWEMGLEALPGKLQPRANAQPERWVNHESAGRVRQGPRRLYR